MLFGLLITKAYESVEVVSVNQVVHSLYVNLPQKKIKAEENVEK